MKRFLMLTCATFLTQGCAGTTIQTGLVAAQIDPSLYAANGCPGAQDVVLTVEGLAIDRERGWGVVDCLPEDRTAIQRTIEAQDEVLTDNGTKGEKA